MPDGYSAVRARLHDKSHDYFVFAHDRWERAKRNMFYGATDALLDASDAAASYGRSISSDAGTKLLACYGFLQALYVQQDAVIALSRAVGLTWHPNNDQRLKKIRDARNRLTGHPALAGEREKPQRLSSAIIPYDSITQRGFRGHVYYEDGFEDIEVDVVAYQKDNESQLAQQMVLVEKRMDEQERQFRTEGAARPFSSCFENGFEYLLQRLWCDLNDGNRIPQAETHAQMIREKMRTLEKELIEHGFVPEATLLQIIFTGLDLLEDILKQGLSSKTTQDKFDLIYDGLKKKIGSLRATLGALDEKFRAPVS